MHKNCERAYRAWKAGEALKACKAIWTDGTTLYSYSTAIARKSPSGVIFNRTYYTTTTAIQQRAIRDALDADGFKIRASLAGIEKGSGPLVLWTAAEQWEQERERKRQQQAQPEPAV